MTRELAFTQPDEGMALSRVRPDRRCLGLLLLIGDQINGSESDLITAARADGQLSEIGQSSTHQRIQLGNPGHKGGLLTGVHAARVRPHRVAPVVIMVQLPRRLFIVIPNGS